jgi:hypothetical protein
MENKTFFQNNEITGSQPSPSLDNWISKDNTDRYKQTNKISTHMY